MSEQDELFEAEHIDEQIERYAQKGQTSAERLIHDLYRSHHIQEQDDAYSLEQAWRRIAQQRFLMGYHLQNETSESMLELKTDYPFVGNKPVSHRTTKSGQLQRFVVGLASIIIMTLIVGSLLTVMNMAHRSQMGNTDGYLSSTVPLGTTLYTYTGQNFFQALEWSPSGQRIASVGFEGRTSMNTMDVKAWDALTGKNTFTYPFKKEYITDAHWSHDGKYIALSSANHVYIYNAATGKLLYTSPTPPVPIASMAIPVNPTVMPNQVGTFLPLQYNGAKQQMRLIGDGGPPPIPSFAWSPDDQYIAFILPGYNRLQIQIWNTTTGKVNTTFGNDNAGSSRLTWSPDGRYVATASVDKSVRIWNAFTGQNVYTYSNYSLTAMSDHMSPAAWSPDSQYIAFPAKGNIVQVYRALTNTLAMSFPGTNVGAIAWSPNGQRIAIGDDQGVELHDATKGTLLYTYKDNLGPIFYLTWSPNSQLIASVNGPKPYVIHNHFDVKVWVAASLPK